MFNGTVAPYYAQGKMGMIGKNLFVSKSCPEFRSLESPQIMDVKSVGKLLIMGQINQMIGQPDLILRVFVM